MTRIYNWLSLVVILELSKLAFTNVIRSNNVCIANMVKFKMEFTLKQSRR